MVSMEDLAQAWDDLGRSMQILWPESDESFTNVAKDFLDSVCNMWRACFIVARVLCSVLDVYFL